MAKAVLDIAGAKYDVLSYSIGYSRGVDSKGRPGGNVQGGELNMTIDAPFTTDLAVQMVNKGHIPIPTGTITISKSEEDGGKLKDIIFTDGFLTGYSESFSAFGGDNITLGITIHAQKIKNGEAEQVNDWPVDTYK
ncbi:type VI secretion system tube protein TssD [uncultured Fibrella sp.]|uniref:type VI secretion system tube protein TssD n=1 Tax=uncultured Fibrella sp. TaxID=1284596 RepID=UPI0035CB4425